jgi:DNA invertase Pin-like site-specific DNA recombinase
MQDKAVNQRRAIAYVRVSTQEQADHGISLEAQEARIRAYVTMRGLELVKVVIDAGVSAGKYTLDEREGGKLVLAAVRSGLVRHVIALKLDRLFRDAEDALHHTKAWDKAGVSLHLIDLGGASIDTSTAMGRMFLTMMAGFAEMERNLTAERTIAALDRKREKGERLGVLPYGKCVDADGVHLIDHPTEQAVIATVRELRASGLSHRAIAAELNHRGMVNRAGGAFQKTQIIRMLDDREGTTHYDASEGPEDGRCEGESQGATPARAA